MQVKRPAFWICLGLLSLGAAVIGARYFPDAFSIVSLEITMDRERALADARAIAERHGLGPPGFQEAASFTLDSETQTFVELEAGGKDAFTQMMRDRLYSAYTWRVRHFKEGEANETLIRFTPDGTPYGFVERLKEDAPGATLEAGAARQLAESAAASGWQVDLSRYALVEQGQERKPGGRVDHTITYERVSPMLGEGRYRLRLVVAGDRLTEVTHFVQIPQAFTRRYASMRSANEAIGIGGAVGMALIYVIIGIGVGLFYMLRARWVLWRHAAWWGVFIAFLQALAAINEWPLSWMTYDTALPRSTFLAQQIAIIIASFVGFAAFFALSFIAAETLTRRAFGDHPQFWRVWAKEPGSSTAILGRTVAGFLMVSVFFAYEVALYIFATRKLGWWTPSEALIHPDVLATYVPWLSAIANSLQAGFWEESLFRAVPIAGAALIGQYLGQRRLFIVLAFVLQALIFGAGHAPYPTLPSYARPVELIIPSIFFGLLYLWWGLLPAIILHFAFDVVWFALPIFIADAPGIWLQRAMVILLTFVPLWVVLWRRAQTGSWSALDLRERNAAWTPPPIAETSAPHREQQAVSLGSRTRMAWLAVGALSAIFFVWAVFSRPTRDSLPVSRDEAVRIARQALETQGVTLGPQWRFMTIPDDGSGTPHEFVSTTAGEARRRGLLDSYLARPRWIVRVATFRGDVAERAEEWRVYVSRTGTASRPFHTLPEGRAGASLSEAEARALAHASLMNSFKLDANGGQVKEIMASPAKLTARTDWTFTFTDTTVQPLPQGEPRITIVVAGNEVAQARRYVFVPDEWNRRARAAQTRNTIGQVLTTLVFGVILALAAVFGVVAWSRRRFAVGLFAMTAAVMFALSLASAANNWPTTLAALPTSQPLQLQVLGLIGVGLVGLVLISVLVGLAIGAAPHRLAHGASLEEGDAWRLGLAAGLFGTGVGAIAAWLRTPEWADFVNVGGQGSVVPLVAAVVGPLPGLFTRVAIVINTLIAIDVFSAGWTRRRLLSGLALVVVGIVATGLPQGAELSGWMLASAITGVALLCAYAFLLRADLTMAVPALGVMIALGVVAQGLNRAYPASLAGSLAAAVIAIALAWWWFRTLRRARDRAITQLPSSNSQLPKPSEPVG